MMTRSADCNLQWMTQSSPTRTPGPRDVGMNDRAGADGRADPTVTKEPIETSAPSVASRATALSGWMPFEGVALGAKSASAPANAAYGLSARSTAHGGAASPVV